MKRLIATEQFTTEYVFEHQDDIDWDSIPISDKRYADVDVKNITNQKCLDKLRKIRTVSLMQQHDMIGIFTVILAQCHWVLSKPELKEFVKLFGENKEFWHKLITDAVKYIRFVDAEDIVKYQCFITDWEQLFCYGTFTEQEIKHMKCITSKNFWKSLCASEYVRFLTLEELVNMQDEVNWRYILRNDILSDEDVEYLLKHVNNAQFVTYIDKKYNVHITVDYLIENQNEIAWIDMLEKSEFTENEIKQLFNSVDNQIFWGIIPRTNYVKYLTSDMIIEHAYCMYIPRVVNNVQLPNEVFLQLLKSENVHIFNACLSSDNLTMDIFLSVYKLYDDCDIEWIDLLRSHNWAEEDIDKLYNFVESKRMQEALFHTKYVNYLDLDDLLAEANYDDLANLFTYYKFTKQELDDLDLTDDSIRQFLLHSEYVSQLSMDVLIKYQDEVDWNVVCGSTLTKDDVVLLLTSSNNPKTMLSALLNSENISNVPTKLIIQYAMYVDDWDRIFTITDFTSEQLDMLKNNIKNDELQYIVGEKSYVHNMSFDEIVDNQDAISWEYITYNDLQSLSEDEKKLLTTTVVEFGARNATQITNENFAEIKNLPNDYFYTFNADLHSDRQGAFVVLQVNQPESDVIFGEFEHSQAIIEYNVKKNYSNDILNQLLRIEGSGVVVSGKMNLKSEKKKENEYNKSNLRCCCGYIHLDNAAEHAIAIMDADRCHDYSPHQVAQLLKGKSYKNAPIIAVGITNSRQAGSAFLKVAKKTRLLKSISYKILYWL